MGDHTVLFWADPSLGLVFCVQWTGRVVEVGTVPLPPESVDLNVFCNQDSQRGPFPDPSPLTPPHFLSDGKVIHGKT